MFFRNFNFDLLLLNCILTKLKDFLLISYFNYFWLLNLILKFFLLLLNGVNTYFCKSTLF